MNCSYFDAYDKEEIFDSLTGAINKKYIIEFINHLINDKIPFSLTLFDLDNFKLVNDNYGHNVGDIVLKDVGSSIVNYFKDAVVGRFGGDEFMIVIPDMKGYDDQYNMISGMVKSSSVVRRHVKHEGLSIYVTSTTGTAEFPGNANDYEELMMRVDQALYRGKMKGRNCYIVYVEEKHKDINAKIVAKVSLMDVYNKIDNFINVSDNATNALRTTCSYFKEIFSLEPMYIANNGDVLMSGMKYKLDNFVELGSFDSVLKDKTYAGLYKLDSHGLLNEAFKKDVTSKGYHSAIVIKLEYKSCFYGYLLFLDSREDRLWHESEICACHYLSKIISIEFYNENN